MRTRTRGVAVVLGVTLLSGCALLSPPLLSPTAVDAAPFASGLERASRAVGRVLSTSCAGTPIAGTGFVVGPGLVLTAAHVVTGARQVSFRPGGAAPVAAEVVGLDQAGDTALLRAVLPADVPELALATDATAPGTDVAALGFPLGEPEHRTDLARITSVTDTAIVNDRPAHDLVTLDATLRPGTSGGPAVDTAGTVRGMVVAAIAGRGGRDSVPTVALAIPPASLGRSLAEWRDDPAVVPEPCAGDSVAAQEEPFALVDSTGDPSAGELVQTLWLLGTGINAGQSAATLGLLTPARRDREGGAEGWAATVAGTRWLTLDVRSTRTDGDRATARVSLRNTTDAACRTQVLDLGFQRVGGAWLVDTGDEVGDAAACG